MGLHYLDKIFEPKSNAVVGAREKEGSMGYVHMRNPMADGYPGQVFPINQRCANVPGVKAHPSLVEINRPIDLAIIAIPISKVPQMIEECVQLGVGGAIAVFTGTRERISRTGDTNKC